MKYGRQPLISIHVPREGHDPSCSVLSHSNSTDFNPRAPRGARHGNKTSSTDLSKHFNPRAPRGARLARLKSRRTYPVISIHVPREGHDSISFSFIPTSSNFNPRAPRGARPGDITAPIAFFTISIHVPREGHDYLISKPAAARKIFQSTCPARGTTWLYYGAGIF